MLKFDVVSTLFQLVFVCWVIIYAILYRKISKFYEWVLQITIHSKWRHSDVTKYAILRDFLELGL